MSRDNRIYLIRHGQVEGHERYPAYGHTDVDLTDMGLLQMKRAAERLSLLDIGAVYSSDLKRSLEGGRQVALHHDVSFKALPELREMFFGEWEGLSLSEIRDRYPDDLARRGEDLLHFEPPGPGETIAAFSERITNCVERVRAGHHGKDLAIVGHGGVNRVVLCKAMGLPLTHMFRIHQDYGCLNIIDYYGDHVLVRLMNG